MKRVAWLLLPPLVSFALAGSAHASKPRLRLESALASGCSGAPALEVHFAELELEGQLRARPPSEYRLILDGHILAERPLHVSTFAKGDRRLRLALVLQTTASYAGSLDRIRGGLRDMMRSLPRDARLTIIAYDSLTRRVLPAGDPRQALSALDSLEALGASVDLALDESLILAFRSLGSPEPAVRRLVVLISDGVSRSPKHDVFRGLGNRARALQVAIHPIAFSPVDERGPLLNLGELAKRSLGTMRWAQRSEDLQMQLANLTREIQDQLVLRFAWPDGCRRISRLQVTSGDLVSNALQLDPPGKQERSRAGMSRVVALGLFLVGLAAATVLLVVAARSLARPRNAAGPSKRPRQPRKTAPRARRRSDR